MSKKFTEYLKKLRDKYEFSQEHIAKTIGMSRQTYMQVEKDESELSISGAKKLAELYGIDIADFLACQMTSEPDIKLEKTHKMKTEPDIRISIPQENVEKFRETLLYILEKVGAKPNVGETVIYKLLYFIDFDYYEKYEKQLIGAKYIKNHYGPTPVEFKKIVDDMIENGDIEKVESKHFQYPQRKYLPRKSSSLAKLNARELEHINDVLARLSDKTAKELSDYSHKDVPWITTENNHVIDYETVFYRTKETSVRSYDEEDNV